MSADSYKEQLDSLTGIRFLAAIHVVIFHYASFLVDGRFAPVVKNLIGSGFIGVDLFFVLSGFILTYNYRTALIDSAARWRFWVARLARIYPVYLLALLWTFVDWSMKQTWSISLILKAVLALALMQSWFPTAALFWNGPGWSLSDEWFYYGLFPVLASLAFKLDRKQLVMAVLVIWLVIPVIPGLYVLIKPDGLASPLPSDLDYRWLNFVKYNPLVRLPAFVLGVLSGCLYLGQRKQDKPTIARLSIVSLFLILLIVCCLTAQGLSYLLLHSGFLAPLFALFVLGLANNSMPLVNRVLSWSPFVLLGRVSYGIYILQDPVYKLVDRIMVSASPAFKLAVYLPALIGTAILVYFVVESPARRVINRAFRRCQQRDAGQPAN